MKNIFQYFKRYENVLSDCQKQNITNQPQLKRDPAKKFQQLYQFNLNVLRDEYQEY